MAKPRPPASRKPPPSNSASAYEGDESSLVVMGRIVSAVGVKGWVRLKTFTADPEGLDAFAEWVVRTPQGWRYLALEEFALRPNGTVAKLAGCEDRDAAERLRGADVAVPRQALGEAQDGEMYQVDLVGLEVADEAGAVLGKVESFFETGDSTVMVVRGGRERLIPFVPEYVRGVDRDGKRITVHWEAGYDE